MSRRILLVYMVSRTALTCEHYAAGCTKTEPKILQVKRGQKQRNAPGKARKRRNRVRFGCWKEKDGEILILLTSFFPSPPQEFDFPGQECDQWFSEKQDIPRRLKLVHRKGFLCARAICFLNDMHRIGLSQ